MKGTPTRYPGVFKLADGRFLAKVAVRVGSKIVFREQALPAGATDSDAVRAVQALKEDVRSQEAAAAPDARRRRIGAEQTLRSYAEQWLKAKAARLRPSVADEWTHRLAVHIFPTLGDVRLCDLDRMALERWVGWAEKAKQKGGKPYSSDTVAGWWRLLTQVVRDASADHDLPDPVRRVQAPRIHAPKVREKDTLDKGQVAKFLDAVRQYEPEWFATAAFLAWTGARAGEVLGVHWEDVDFAKRCIHLCRSATRGVEQRIKTDVPRDVPMLPQLVEVLQSHRQQQIAAQHPGLKSGLVFPNEKGGLRLAQALAKPFNACSGQVGQHVTPQVLRRSFNTIMLAEGVDPIFLRAIMGHVSAEMTERYAGVPMKAKQEAVGRAFGGPT